MMVTAYGTALVTGGSGGIGTAVCRKLSASGITVLAIARNAEKLEALRAECGVIPICVDLTDLEEVQRRIAGHAIDVLVNNAGSLSTIAPLHEQSLEEITRTVALNLSVPLALARLVLPGMVARRSGHIFNITSVAAHSVLANCTIYSATKAGLSMAGRALRHDLVGTNVRVTEIAPGRVKTDFYLEAYRGERQRLEQTIYDQHRALLPNDVADALVAALSFPPHVDVSMIELMPTDQATGGHAYATHANRNAPEQS